MRSDNALLLDMLLACQKIFRFTQGIPPEAFLENDLVQSAVIRELQVIGEASRLVSQITREQYPDIAWRSIIGMRHRLVHEYFSVDVDLVWQTLIDDIPELLRAL